MSDIVAGRNPVLEALKSGRAVNKILVDKNITRHSTIAEILSLAARQHVPVEYVDGRALIQTVPAGAQGIIAYTAAKEYVSLEDVLNIARTQNEAPFLVILDGIEDPQNLGAILRTAEATGVHGVIIRSRRAVGLTAGVARASAGAIEYVPVARVTNIVRTIEELKNDNRSCHPERSEGSQGGDINIWITGIDMTGEIDFRTVDYKTGTALVIGGEGQGLSELVRKRCDTVARIPMKGKIASLNASVAAALAMYEVYRQRNNNQETSTKK